MRLGIDIDDVITNTSEKIKEAVMKCENSEKINEQMVEIMRGTPTTEEAKKFTKDVINSNVFKEVTLKENAAKVINSLLREGHEIYLITARGDENELFKGSEKITLEYLKHNQINYTKILFSSYDKAKLCKENHIDLMIDDSVKHCEAVRDENIKSIVFTSDVNKSIETTVTRVSNWLELEEKIRELA